MFPTHRVGHITGNLTAQTPRFLGIYSLSSESLASSVVSCDTISARSVRMLPSYQSQYIST